MGYIEIRSIRRLKEFHISHFSNQSALFLYSLFYFWGNADESVSSTGFVLRSSRFCGV